jgi:hypothetical protein
MCVQVSLKLTEKNTDWRVLENWVPRRIFGAKKNVYSYSKTRKNFSQYSPRPDRDSNLTNKSVEGYN